MAYGKDASLAVVSVGIDAGIEYLKIVMLNDLEVVVQKVVAEEYDPIGEVAARALREIANAVGIPLDRIDIVVATGIGREFVQGATLGLGEHFCLSRGMYHLLPHVRTIVDVGAEALSVIKCNDGKPVNKIANDKCAAGTGGRYFKMVAEILDLDIDEMAKFPYSKSDAVDILSTCAIFAESEIISVVHAGAKPTAVLNGVFKGLVQRINPLLIRIGFENEVALSGGVVLSRGVKEAFEVELRQKVVVPPSPQTVGALGAAILGGEHIRASGGIR